MVRRVRVKAPQRPAVKAAIVRLDERRIRVGSIRHVQRRQAREAAVCAEPEHRAGVIGAAGVSCAVKVALRILCHGPRRLAAAQAAAERMKVGVTAAVFRNAEDDAGVARPAGGRHPVQIAIPSLEQRRLGACAVGPIKHQQRGESQSSPRAGPAH